MGKAMLTVLKEDSKDKREGLFSLDANNNTLKCEMMSKFNIVFPPRSRFYGNFIGISIWSARTQRGERHHSIYNVGIMKVPIIRIDLSLMSMWSLDIKLVKSRKIIFICR